MKSQKKCRNPGLNQGPLDLQSNALPTELGLGEDRLREGGKREKRERRGKKGEKRREREKKGKEKEKKGREKEKKGEKSRKRGEKRKKRRENEKKGRKKEDFHKLLLTQTLFLSPTQLVQYCFFFY